MSLGLQLILSTTLVAAAPAPCSWAHPGANPYRGDPVRALDDFALPDETRRQLREMMRAHRYTDLATITRDDIAGEHGYADLRDMHSGRGQVCRGAVDRSAWSDTHRERGLVYCAGDTCVIVPTVCNNVSLVTRKGDEPIDIEPAAGPPATPVTPAATPGEIPVESDPLAFVPPAAADPGEPGDGGSGGGSPGGGSGGGGSGWPGAGASAGGGGGLCCSTGTPVPPVGTVPEPPAWLLLLAGAAWLAGRRR